MADINITITHEGTNISTWVIDYDRNSNICSGIATLDVVVDPDTPRTFSPGDEIILKEEGNKIGEFYVGAIIKDEARGYTLTCQDNSKWLQAYFIADFYTTNGLSSRYWIGRILDEAKLSYNFTTSSQGYYLPPDDKIALEYGYDVVLRLCQQSGWYFYFDGNGTCQIGQLGGSWHSPQGSIKESDGNILREFIESDDAQLRNKVVVWGGAASSEGSRIFTELSTSTPWDRDVNDERTIVLANHYIRDYGTAWTLGKKLLDEHSKTTSIKVYEIAGYVNSNLGDIVYCDTRIFKGTGRITTINSKVSSGGFITTITIDERCPRLFGYWAYGTDEYVYIGTNGNGVWRKTLGGSTWSNFSSGLVNLYIRDLKIKNGVFLCTTDDYRAYIRTVNDSSWVQLSPGVFIDEDTETEYSLEDLITAGCGIDELTGDVYVGYNHIDDKRAWVVKRSPDETFAFYQVATENAALEKSYSYKIVDTDTNNKSIILSGENLEGVEFDTDIFIRSTGERGIHTTPSSGIDHQYSLDHITKTPNEISYTALYSNHTDWYPGWDGTYLYFLERDPVPNPDDWYVRQWDVANDTKKSLSVTTAGFTDLHGYVKDETVVHGYYSSSTSYLYKVDFSGTPTETLLKSYTSDKIFDHCYTYIDSNNDGIIIWMTAKLSAKNGSYSYEDVQVHFTNINDSTTKTVNINFSGIDSNVTIDSIWNYMWNMPASTDYVVVPLTCYTSKLVTPGVHEYYLPIIKIKLSNETVSYEMVTITALTGVEMTVYTGVYDPYSDKFYFNLEGYDQTDTDRLYKLVVPNSASSYSIDYLGDTNDYWMTRGIIGTERSYYVTANGTIKYASTDNIVDTTPDGSENTMLTHVDDLTGNFWYFSQATDYLTNQNGATKFQTNDPSTGTRFPFFCGKNLCLCSRGYLYFYSPVESDLGGVSKNALKSKSPIPTSGVKFNKTYTFVNELQLEISRESPIIFFGGYTPEEMENQKGQMEMYFTPDATSGTFFSMSRVIEGTFSLPGFVPDARVGDVLGLAGSTSGWIMADPPTDYARYAFVTQLENVGEQGDTYFKNAWAPFDSWKWFDTFSGHAWRMETTNYVGNSPYVFVSTSGTPSRFFQLDYDEEIFTEYSTGLPTGNITVIRVDDRI